MPSAMQQISCFSCMRPQRKGGGGGGDRGLQQELPLQELPLGAAINDISHANHREGTSTVASSMLDDGISSK